MKQRVNVQGQHPQNGAANSKKPANSLWTRISSSGISFTSSQAVGIISLIEAGGVDVFLDDVQPLVRKYSSKAEPVRVSAEINTAGIPLPCLKASRASFVPRFHGHIWSQRSPYSSQRSSTPPASIREMIPTAWLDVKEIPEDEILVQSEFAGFFCCWPPPFWDAVLAIYPLLHPWISTTISLCSPTPGTGPTTGKTCGRLSMTMSARWSGWRLMAWCGWRDASLPFAGRQLAGSDRFGVGDGPRLPFRQTRDGASVYGLVATIVFGVSLKYNQAATWYSASFLHLDVGHAAVGSLSAQNCGKPAGHRQ